MVANLKPAVLCGVESNGMVLAAGEETVRVVFLSADTPLGERVMYHQRIDITKQKNGTFRAVLRIGGEVQNEDNGNRLRQMGVPDHVVS